MSKQVRRNRRYVAFPRRVPTEIDLMALRLIRGETLIKGVCDCLKTFAKWGAILGCAVCIYKSVETLMTGLTGMTDKLAAVFRNVYLHDTVYVIAIIIFGGSSCLRKWRNRRLTKLVGEQRHELEGIEAANVRSGLDPHGEAAEDKE